MNDEERWIRGQGPPPLEIRELFDAMRAPPPMSADVPEELERRVLARFEAEGRREARARKAKWAVAALAVLAIGAAGGAVALTRVQADAEAMPPRTSLARSHALGQAPPKPAEAKPAPTGSAGRP
jgi:hypothetical protein